MAGIHDFVLIESRDIDTILVQASGDSVLESMFHMCLTACLLHGTEQMDFVVFDDVSNYIEALTEGMPSEHDVGFPNPDYPDELSGEDYTGQLNEVFRDYLEQLKERTDWNYPYHDELEEFAQRTEGIVMLEVKMYSNDCFAIRVLQENEESLFLEEINPLD